ncbi:UvrD-helicase domain-containing protein [Kerstersia sp.]|uniref:UvrD-helicase domain-containing protein n=1 Tax=Kerstersia sp. TaxID=1930783 RepID=UPI003F8F4E46
MDLDRLNPEQRAAVTLDPCHALVLAGAGSGKTRVLTTRMAWLVQTGQASPFGLLAVTFTNKAAREMLARLTAMLPLDPRGLWIGTFHGLCNRLLRAHHRDAGLPQSFQILDSADQLSAIKRLLKAANVDDEKYPPRDVQRFINHAKEEGQRPDTVITSDPHSRRLAEIYALYQEQCDREGVVDFAELLLRAYELLSRNAPVREHYQRRFRHILVDEFQDTNALQYRWLRLLAGGGAHVFAVGDDDQSIYAFRGADVGNMSAFVRDYAGEHVIRLEQNYRSYGHILDAANALISHNTGRLGKNLWTAQGEGERIRVCEQPSDGLEAQWVVDELKSLAREGMPRSEIAILYRSNAQSRVLEHALFSAGVPYKVYGGLRFFERQEVKHALAYLRLLANPDDDTSWLRVVNFPARGIGARTLEALADQARTYSTSLYGAVARVPGKGGANLAQFTALIGRLWHETRSLPLPEMVAHIIEHSGLVAHYQTEREGEERLENLRELVAAAAAFVAEENYEGMPAGLAAALEVPAIPEGEAFFGEPPAAGISPLAAFLSHASLEAGDNQAQAGEDAIQMMTVHAAKGLEFDAVFMTGMEEGLFPHENSLSDPEGLEEERRLMYVAITRARKRLYLSLAQSRMLHGQTRYAMRSRFFQEIPEQHLKWLTPKASSHNSAGWGGPAPRALADAFGRQSTGRLEPRQARHGSNVVKVGEREYRVGMGVSHARFGEGTIIELSGNGEDAQARIHFRDAGQKTLALGIAKLDVVAG